MLFAKIRYVCMYITVEAVDRELMQHRKRAATSTHQKVKKNW